jgi:Tfp pilus assembly protein PilX
MKKFTQTEQGFVSIFVTTMLIIIVSLLVLAFAQVSRREQRQTLDTQLSSQAYYAAETGVNDAKAAIMASPGADVSRTSCTDYSRPYDALDNTKDLAGNGSVAYTCVLVDAAPTAIPVTVGKDPQVIPLQTNDNHLECAEARRVYCDKQLSGCGQCVSRRRCVGLSAWRLAYGPRAVPGFTRH